MDMGVLAIIGLIALVVMLILGVNIGFSMFIIGFIGYAVAMNFNSALGMLATQTFAGSMKLSFTVIPLFILMGQFAYHAGISKGLFDAAQAWLGRTRGGAAMAAVVACALFGAICGSLPATTATMAIIAMPEMRRRGYDDQISAGCIATAGTLGTLIPPSTTFILYGIAAEVSIGRLFASGVVPGLILAAGFCIVVFVQGKIYPGRVPEGQPYKIKDKFKSLIGLIPMVILFGSSIGGMFAGVFSAMEAAGVGAFLALVIMIFMKQFTWEKFFAALRETVKSTGMVLLIIVGANMFGYFLSITRVAENLAAWVEGLALPAVVIMIIIVIIYAILGCFIDGAALVILSTPIFLPIVKTLGYDPVWFGCMMVCVANLGSITPPIGMSCYVAAGVMKDVPLATIFKGIVPNILVYLIVMIGMAFVPGVVTWLPNLIYGG
ncbi:MAG: TRAP transporter large permease [Lachnospiraceae bacterium]|jgi:C4-dicarboxylate transporter DctM subunit